MKSQIFKSIVPITILFELLEKICVKDDKCYTLCKSSFKAAEYHNLVVGFCERIIEHYHVSKRYYVDRKMNYNKFITVVRQICGINNVSYTSKIVYNKSDYEILYYISKEPTQAPNGAGNVPSETGQAQAGNVPSGTGQAPNGAGNVPNCACNMPAQAPNGAGNVPNGACNMQVNEAPVKKVRQRRAKKEKKVNDESNATPVSAANVSNATPVSAANVSNATPVSVSLANTTPVSVSNANVSVSVSVSEANTNTNTTSNTTILQPQQVRHFQTQLLAHAHAIQAQAKALEAFITYSL